MRSFTVSVSVYRRPPLCCLAYVLHLPAAKDTPGSLLTTGPGGRKVARFSEGTATGPGTATTSDAEEEGATEAALPPESRAFDAFRATVGVDGVANKVCEKRLSGWYEL